MEEVVSKKGTGSSEGCRREGSGGRSGARSGAEGRSPQAPPPGGPGPVSRLGPHAVDPPGPTLRRGPAGAGAAISRGRGQG